MSHSADMLAPPSGRRSTPPETFRSGSPLGTPDKVGRTRAGSAGRPRSGSGTSALYPRDAAMPFENIDLRKYTPRGPHPFRRIVSVDVDCMQGRFPLRPSLDWDESTAAAAWVSANSNER